MGRVGRVWRGKACGILFLWNAQSNRVVVTRSPKHAHDSNNCDGVPKCGTLGCSGYTTGRRRIVRTGLLARTIRER